MSEEAAAPAGPQPQLDDEPRVFSPAARAKLTPHHLPRYPSESLFDRLGRAVCRADCLPRKELYEAWEVVRRTRRRFRGGRVVDLACGHALAAWLMLLLDDTSPSAIAVDTRIPGSAAPLGEELVKTWPRLKGRVEISKGKLQSVPIHEGDLVVSVHACGHLTDKVIEASLAARARIAVLPCCHDAKLSDTGGLEGWVDQALAIDATRVHRLRAAGYHVYTQTIPATITPKNRLLLASPVNEQRHR
jgi:hypothetical protein